MLRVALREIRAHLVRFLLSVLAVTLGIAFVSGTFSLRQLLSDTFGSIVASTTQGDVYVRGETISADDGGAPTGGGTQTLGEPRRPVPLDLVDRVSGVAGVDQAVPDLLGTAVVIGADGQAVVNGQAPSLGSALRENDPSGTLVAGRVPRDASEIALETTALETSGLQLGDTTQVVVGTGPLTEVTVVGEVTYGNPMVGTTLVLVDAATGEAAFAPDGEVPSIAVFAQEGTGAGELADRVADALSGVEGVEVATGEEVRDEANEAITQMLGFLSTFLLVFALISLFVGAFIISNTFAMSVRQRQREFALLRAVGASPGQVLRTVLVQAGLVGLVGSGLGVIAGTGLIALVRAWLATMGMELTGDVVVGPDQALLAVGIGTGISLVAASVPARRAAVTPPVEAMRDDVAVVERTLHVRTAVGAVLLAGGVWATWLSVQDSTDHAGRWLGAGAAGVLLGALAVSPAIARAVVRVLAWPFLVLRPVGRLARGNVMRNPRRTAATAGALMIGMALVGACAVLAESAQASTSSIVATESRADFWVQSATRTVPPDAAERIAVLPEVGRADTVRVGRATVAGPGGDPGGRQVMGLPPGAFGATIAVEVVDGDLDGLADGGVALARATAQDQGWRVGDVLRVTESDGTVRDAPVAAVIDSQMLASPVVMSDDAFSAAVPSGTAAVLAVLVDRADGVTADRLRAALEETVAPYVVLTVQDAEELTSSLAEQVDQAMVILYALLGLSVVIAVLGIVNTLALSVIERTREIGLMRAVGLGRLQLAATITVESVLTAVFGTVLGVVVGVGLASALPSVFADQGLTELAVPWDLLAGMVLLSGLVGVVAALWPAVRAARLPVLDAVATE